MIKNYLLYNEDNIIKQFTRCDEAEIELYQSSYIEIEEDSFVFDSNYNYKIESGKVVSYEKTDISYMLQKLNKEFETEILKLTSSTPLNEISTWTKQELEAREWLKDSTYPTPLIDAICEARECEKSYLVGKIIEKADAYAIAVGTLTGIRQKLEKEISGE